MKTIDLNPEVNDPFIRQLGLRYPEKKYSTLHRVHYMTYDGLMRYITTEGLSPFRKAYLTATTEETLKASDKHQQWIYVDGLVDTMVQELKEQIGQHPLLMQYLTQHPIVVIWSGKNGKGAREKRWVSIVTEAITRLGHAS